MGEDIMEGPPVTVLAAKHDKPKLEALTELLTTRGFKVSYTEPDMAKCGLIALTESFNEQVCRLMDLPYFDTDDLERFRVSPQYREYFNRKPYAWRTSYAEDCKRDMTFAWPQLVLFADYMADECRIKCHLVACRRTGNNSSNHDFYQDNADFFSETPGTSNTLDADVKLVFIHLKDVGGGNQSHWSKIVPATKPVRRVSDLQQALLASFTFGETKYASSKPDGGQFSISPSYAGPSNSSMHSLGQQSSSMSGNDLGKAASGASKSSTRAPERSNGGRRGHLSSCRPMDAGLSNSRRDNDPDGDAQGGSHHSQHPGPPLHLSSAYNDDHRPVNTDRVLSPLAASNSRYLDRLRKPREAL